MTYAIGQIVFGIDLQVPYRGPDAFDAVREQIELLSERDIIATRYSGNGEPPVYFGIDVGEIDEINTIDGADLIRKLTVTPERMAEYGAKLKALEDDSPDVFAAIFTVAPRMFITWGSS